MRKPTTPNKASGDNMRRESDLRRRWAATIDNAPFESINPATLRSIVKAMRSFSTERDEGKITLQQYRELAMNLLCDAIGAGAFAGPEWIKFRARLASDPSFENAVKFLETDTPRSLPIIKAIMNKPDDGTFQLSAYIDRCADQIKDEGFRYSDGNRWLYFGGQGSLGPSNMLSVCAPTESLYMILPPDQARGLAEYILNRPPLDPKQPTSHSESTSHETAIPSVSSTAEFSTSTTVNDPPRKRRFWSSFWRGLRGPSSIGS